MKNELPNLPETLQKLISKIFLNLSEEDINVEFFVAGENGIEDSRAVIGFGYSAACPSYGLVYLISQKKFCLEFNDGSGDNVRSFIKDDLLQIVPTNLQAILIQVAVDKKSMTILSTNRNIEFLQT